MDFSFYYTSLLYCVYIELAAALENSFFSSQQSFLTEYCNWNLLAKQSIPTVLLFSQEKIKTLELHFFSEAEEQKKTKKFSKLFLKRKQTKEKKTPKQMNKKIIKTPRTTA